MGNNEMEYWLFNTDETEPEGKGKHKVMLREQVVAAWGSCKDLGAEVTLNRPNPGDVVYFYLAGVGIIARAVANDSFASESQSVFGADGEYIRPVEALQVLPDTMPVTVAEIKEETEYQIPYRQIMGRILDASTIEYLNRRFHRTKTQATRASRRKSGGYVGFYQPNPEERRKVERAAVRVVSKVYKKAKWQVKSVEAENVGYDLHCTKDNLVECVEVKGTSGGEERFVITANELTKAKTDKRFVLYVVTNALYKPVPQKYSGKQLLAKFDIQPIQFRASPKSTE